ncbi:MAG TPA: hypothetical protein VGD67_06425 [Pseudonocardiaceae bacterium]
MLLRLTRVFGIALAAGLAILLAPPPPASAATVYLSIMWIHCNDQSEPFSDEIRLRVAGAQVGSWDDVDGGETHWYYSSSFTRPLNIPFSGGTTVNVHELDGSDLGLIGWINISEGEVDQGERQQTADQYDGSYTLRYLVTSSPI